jgi:uncharacterized protein (UPF0276 family)
LGLPSSTPAAQAGIGLRDPHFRQVDETRPAIGWLEVHTENFFGHDRSRQARLQRIREQYPLGLHGVGLSLGSADGLDRRHLDEVCRLVERYQPWIVSEHACWGGFGALHTNALLPLPRTTAALDVLCANIGRVQDRLRRPIAVENIASYLGFTIDEMDEADFLAALVRRSGCQLIVDLDNLHINSCNHGFDAVEALARLPAAAVAEYHLAGHQRQGATLIDTHSEPVPQEVWSLFRTAIELIGPRPSLIERDQNIPALDELVAEMNQAKRLLSEPLHAPA